jgi:hypothetical protein
VHTVRGGGFYAVGWHACLSPRCQEAFLAPVFIQPWHCEHLAVRDAVVYSSRAYAGARVALQ